MCKFLVSILFTVLILGEEVIGEFREEVLDTDGNYNLKWSIDYINKMVTFEVLVNTDGFIGFGISPSGGMSGADILIMRLYPNGTVYCSDRHGTGETEPVIDEKQDWTCISGQFNGTHTTMKFSRKFDTCDEQDVPLTTDTTHFIWAYFPGGNSDAISYHGTKNRGTLTVQPLDPAIPQENLEEYFTYEISHNMTMPSTDTTYWCTIHKSPVFLSKHHIVAFEPLLKTPEARAHTHHYNIFRCTAPDGVTPEEYFEQYIGGEGGECYIPNPVIPTAQCQTMFYNWAVGGKMLILPSNIGYPIGETGSPVDYYMFEIHYNNPEKLSGVEFETGATIYYTNETREHDAGLMVVAHHTSIALAVPPKSSAFKTVGHCASICTENYLPEDGINVFAIFLHAHLSGRKMKFRQFRGNEELPWPANDETYDFEFQQTRLLSDEVKVLPGDQLTMECIYDTRWREGTTVGGLSTSDEMCQSIFWYYPRAELRDCRSEYPIEKLFKKFGIENATRNTVYEDAIITLPAKYAGMRYTEVLNSANWTQELRQNLQDETSFSSHEGVCMTPTTTRSVTAGYPNNIKEYKPLRECPSSAISALNISLVSWLALIIIHI